MSAVMIHHAALVQTSREESIRWFVEVLGFQLENDFLLDPRVTAPVFELEGQDVQVLHFRTDSAMVEVFLRPDPETRHFSHVCIECSSHEALIDSLSRGGYRHVHVRRPERPDLLFAFDRDGNRFEFNQTSNNQRGNHV